MSHRITAVEQTRQRIGHGRLKAMLKIVAQTIRQAFVLNEFADPQRHLFAVKAVFHDVLRAQVQGIPMQIARRAVEHHQNGGVPCGRARPYLRNQPQ